jgi:hypothetical protein
MMRPDPAAQEPVAEAVRKVGHVSGVTLEQLEAMLRNDFLSFIQKTFNSLVPNEPFLMNWHIRALAHRLKHVWFRRKHSLHF